MSPKISLGILAVLTLASLTFLNCGSSGPREPGTAGIAEESPGPGVKPGPTPQPPPEPKPAPRPGPTDTGDPAPRPAPDARSPAN